MARYFLQEHVYFSFCEDGVVFLNLKRDKYVGLDATNARIFEELLQATAPPQAASELEASLLALDLLTPDPQAGKPAAPVELPTAQRSFLDSGSALAARALPGHILNFAIASATAAWMLRRRSLEEAVTRVRQRNAARQRQSRLFDEKAERLARVFSRLRSWVYSAPDQCVFDSYALLEFLAPYGLYPTMVFGVRTGPFAAHCWVQHEDTVLNDSVTRVRMFKPIMLA